VNAAEQARGLDLTTKIAAVVNLFKTQFPDARADLKPWANDPSTRALVDPDSIDIGFHLPGWSPRFQSRSILLQIRLHDLLHSEDLLPLSRRAIGVEAVGFTHEGEKWRLSTIADWSFVGAAQPADPIKQQLKQVCQQIIELFNHTDASG
jgi:hypothetical protein